MKNYEPTDWNEIYELALDIPRETQPFYQELRFLKKNEKFINAVEALRKSLGINLQATNKLNFKEFISPIQLMQDNKKLIPLIRPLVERCTFATGKYKTFLFEAIVSFLYYGNFMTEMADMDIKSGKHLPVMFYSKFEPRDKRVSITLTFHVAAKKAEVIKELKSNWKLIKQYEKGCAENRKSPQRNFARDIDFYDQHNVGKKSYSQIRKSYNKNITTEGVIQAVNRVKHKVNESFN